MNLGSHAFIFHALSITSKVNGSSDATAAGPEEICFDAMYICSFCLEDQIW
jgi:hypothetical protein